MQITEDQIIEQFQKLLEECDADVLAQLTGEAFGGKCYYSKYQSSDLGTPTMYDFEPDENYSGAFDIPE